MGFAKRCSRVCLLLLQELRFCSLDVSGIDPDREFDGLMRQFSYLITRFPVLTVDLTYTPFYSTYCTNRPCVISEGAAAYHVDVTGGASRLDVQRGWWQVSHLCSMVINSY